MKNRFASLLALSLAVPAAGHAQSAAERAEIRLGAPISGVLSADDTVGERGGYADTYTFTGTAGTTMVIAMSSDVFDCYLTLKDASGNTIGTDDDSGDGTNSILTASLPTDGTYTVVASSYGTGATGAYDVTVEEFHPQPLSTQRVAIGDVITGRLDSSDAMLPSYGFADGYDIELAAGDSLTVQVSNSDIGAISYIVAPTGEPAVDPYYGAQLTSPFIAELPGTYRVIVTAYAGFAETDYTVSFGAEAPLALSDAPALEIGRQQQGTLAATDDGAEGQRYAIELSAGDQLAVTMRSEAFDTYLTLLDGAGNELSSDDDSAGNLDSMLTYMIPSSGTYFVSATSYNGSGGQFTILAEVEEPVAVTPVAVEMGAQLTGTLTRGDARSASYGGYVDVYTFDAVAGQPVSARLNSFDAALRLIGPTGEDVNSSGNGGNNIAVQSLPMTGRYMLTVTSYSATEVSYDLTLNDAASAISFDDAPSLSMDTPTQGVLEAGDALSERGSFGDAYTLNVEEAGTYVISQTASDFDGYLYLFSDSGTVLDENDDSNGLNPAVRRFLNPGTYHVVATAFSSGLGNYTMSVVRADASPVVVQSVQFGDVISGELLITDAYSTTRSGPADFYSIELGAGQGATVTLSSEEFDAYLMVFGPAGETVTQDDDGAGNLDSRASFRADRAGIYTIVGSAYSSETGAYSMAVTEGYIAPEYPEVYDGHMYEGGEW